MLFTSHIGHSNTPKLVGLNLDTSIANQGSIKISKMSHSFE